MIEVHLEIFAPLIIFLMAAVVSDLRRHTIPNALVLVGLLAGLIFRLGSLSWEGAVDGLLGGGIGLLLLLPVYALGGMAAGDVKLMALVGLYLGPAGAVVAVACTLIVGMICSFLIVMHFHQLLAMMKRYWLIMCSRNYFAPSEDDIAALRFPYSIAICLGTLTGGLWMSIGAQGG